MRLGGGGEDVARPPRRRARGSRGRPGACCRGTGRCAGTRRPRLMSSCRSVTASARNSMPITCTGRPSAEASSRLSPVIERAGEVARHVQHGRAARAQERVLHLAHDRVQAVRDHREQHRIEGSLGCQPPAAVVRRSAGRARAGSCRARHDAVEPGRRRPSSSARGSSPGPRSARRAAARRRRSAAPARAPSRGSTRRDRAPARARRVGRRARGSHSGLARARPSPAPSRAGTRGTGPARARRRPARASRGTPPRARARPPSARAGSGSGTSSSQTCAR